MNSNHTIKAVFFDLDGTLRHSVPSGGDVFTDYIRTLGLHINEEDRIRAMRWEHLYWASSADLRDDLVAHSADTENFWIEYSRRRLIALGISPAIAREYSARVSAHMGSEYKPESIVPDEVRNALAQLKQNGYRMAVLSNRDRPFLETLETHAIHEFFEFSVAGGEVNSYKPEPGLFEHALQRAGMSAQEAVYVGDNYFADVVGARRAGLTPVLFDPDEIFPEADCIVIKSFDELISSIKDI
ncbi:MAG TPA: HAD family hydrolase [Anaerolineales bacterium]|nr:HAD family hydrolase [Anaerolineales bacterium]